MDTPDPEPSAMEFVPRRPLTLSEKAAAKRLSDIGDRFPTPDSLADIPWESFADGQLAVLLDKASTTRTQRWLGIEDGGWVRDAFLISALEVWAEGLLLKRFGQARFSPSIALRAACKDRPGRIRYDHALKEFCLSTRTGRQLVDRINQEFWTVEEVMEEAHGLYTGSRVLSQILSRAGAARLGTAMTSTLHTHRRRVVELLGRGESRRGVFWTE